MKLHEAKGKPTILNTGVKWEFILDYYDIPLSGIVSFGGVKYYANILDEGGYYAMVILTDEELKAEEYWDQEFIKHVQDGDANLFYEPYKNFSRNYENNEVYGFFLLEDSFEAHL